MSRIDLIQLRRGSTVAWATADTVLAIGEPGYDIDRGVIKVGDGETPWTDLPAAFDEHFRQLSDVAGCQARQVSPGALYSYMVAESIDNDPLGMVEPVGKRDLIIPESGLWSFYAGSTWSASTGNKALQLIDNVNKLTTAAPAGVAVIADATLTTGANNWLAGTISDVPLTAGQWVRLLGFASTGTATFTGRFSAWRSGAPFG